MLTGKQIRAAIAGLRWSRRILSEKSGIPERTIQRIAEAEGVPNTSAKHLEAISDVFKQEGVQFIEQNGGGPGVRFNE